MPINKDVGVERIADVLFRENVRRCSECDQRAAHKQSNSVAECRS
jgi:hypothetical protein